jgi:hypothetical protein
MTRIGTWRSPRLNLGSSWSASPSVATRATEEMSDADTPCKAPISGLGVIRISGRTRAADEMTLDRPGMERISRSTAAAASSSTSPSSPTSEMETWPPPPPSWPNWTRAPGIWRSTGPISCSKACWRMSRSLFLTRLTVMEARRTSPADPPPPGPKLVVAEPIEA